MYKCKTFGTVEINFTNYQLNSFLHTKANKKAKILFSLGFQTPAAFTTSKHGSRALLINGHKYVKDRKTQETINWRCAFFIRFKCKARAITRIVNGIERVKETNGVHTHEMHKFRNDPLDKIYDG